MADEFDIKIEFSVRLAPTQPGVIIRETSSIGHVTYWGPIPYALIDAFLDERKQMISRTISDQVRRLLLEAA